MTRYKASLIHFIASFIVVISIFSFVKLVWYPGELFFAASGNEILLILLIVDLVLGPILTLLVFDKSKTSLKFDLAIIVLVQVSFMVYGIWVIFAARPVYIVHHDNAFHLVTANRIEYITLENRTPKLPFWGPKYAGISLNSKDTKTEKAQIASFVGIGPQYFPEFYIPFQEVKNTVFANAKSLNELANLSSYQKDILRQYTYKLNSEYRRILFVPLITDRSTFFVTLDVDNTNIIEIIEAKTID